MRSIVSRSSASLGCISETSEPPQPLGIRNRSIRRRRRRQDEELRLTEATLLRAELGALAERAAVRLLADERDPLRPQLGSDPAQPLRRTREIGATQITRSAGRAQRRVRHAETVGRQLLLLLRREQPRREPRVIEQPPEVVARVGEMRAG